MSFQSAVKPLLQPIHVTVVLRHLGQLSLILTGLLLVPTLVAWLDGDRVLAQRLLLGALLPAVGLAACALLPRAGRQLRLNEALVITVLSFIVVAALSTWPLASGGLSMLDAWFEAASGVTTTGLSMLSDPAQCSNAYLFTRAWLQWVGGLGIVVLSMALVLGQAADQRRFADALGDDDLEVGARQHARRVVSVYVLLTAIGLAWVSAAGLAWPAAVIHTLAAVSTGGFSVAADSLAALTPRIQLALLVVAFAGALPLPLYYRAWLRGPLELLRDPELRALVAAIGITMALLWLLGGLVPGEALMQAAMAQTTTGFSTVDIAGLPAQAKLVLILSMLGGAGVGSTAGGIKLLRLLILIRLIQLMILRVQLPPHAVVSARLGGHELDARQIEHALIVILLFVLLVVGAWLAFVAAGYVPLDALFEVVSAAATVGLSTGITGIELEPGLKALLTLVMLAGRVEVLALLVLLYPRTWLRP
ncbi:TrkH family potassium uptake protein [Thiohalocapsa marina]|uniref:TrkH family potassium uptake protein n=1 Tax=Thiohalocapsa marina TaxID=424902 RepID=UPI0036DADF8A